MIQPGTILGGRYEIMNHIGSGGMADVYKARSLEEDSFVAIKILRQEYNDDESFVRRFIAEAQATASISHPNIVNVYDAGEDQGWHYIVMELCEGTTLKRYIRRYGRLSVRETVDFSKKIAMGIQAAHRKGIVHRDIKPQNILVSESGEVKVADFGIARATTGDTISQNLMGSVHYLSPEQARGNYSDEKSDIYSLGITMYEMATGRVPFDSENSVSIALMHIREDITPPRCYFPDIPASLEKIILKCTMKRPSDRYRNIDEVLNDLEMVFIHPDGDYVFDKPVVDESPTIHRSKEELEEIESDILEHPEGKLPGDSGAASDSTQDQDTESEEDDSMQPHMRRMIYVITAAGGILLAFIIIYLIVSSTGILRRQKQEATTEIVTTASTTEEILVSMPYLLNKDIETAETMLEQNNLVASFEYEDGVSETDRNLIVTKQQYNAGTKLKTGTTVALTVGINPEATTQSKRVEVPALINMKESEAETALVNAGLKVEKVYASSDTVKSGYVIKQNPTAGTEVDLGFTITITISRGMSQVKVPLLTGLSQKAAKEQLNNVGLNLGEVTSDYNGSVGIGEVFRQGTEPGTMVDRGTYIDVVISLGDSVSFHYEGEIYIIDSPFSEGESGRVEFKILEDKDQETMTTIYTDDNMTADDFPFTHTFECEDKNEVIVIMYVNGSEYRRDTVEVTAVED